MGRREESILRSFRAAVVAGIHGIFDSLLREFLLFKHSAQMAGFCLFGNYLCSQVAFSTLETKT